MNILSGNKIILIITEEDKHDNGFIIKSNKISREYQEATLSFSGNFIVITSVKEGETVGEIFPMDQITKFKIVE